MKAKRRKIQTSKSKFRGNCERRVSAARRWLWLAAAVIVAQRQGRLFANPTGLTVGAGTASVQAGGAQLNVTVSSAALLNWSTFNIQAGETTTFLQPTARSVVLNVIGDRNPSQIFGSLNANGTVILANANGFYFGPNSMIKVGGDFIATTAPITPDFGLGTGWQFTGLPPLASIVNYGQIQAGPGRSLFLIAEDIENHGRLDAPGGDIGLYGGESVLVSESPDGRGLSATVKVPAGAVDNLGRITADAGTIALQAQVVNQNGVLQANSVREENGVIELVAADSLTLGPNSVINARGDEATPGSSGGAVTLKSGNNFSDATGSQITTAGGALGGNGGNVEISAPNILSLNSSIAAGAAAGWSGGSFTLDPENIILGTSGTTAGGPGGTIIGTGAAGTLSVNVNTAFKNITSGGILLEASGNITLSAAWNLSTSTGETGGQLTLEAGQNIIFGSNAQINGAQNSVNALSDWSISLYAGVGVFSPTQPTVTPGVGSIFLGNASSATVAGQTVYTALSNNGSIWAAQGSINLMAGANILIGGTGSTVGGTGAYVDTTAGGNITLQALAGTINAGTGNAYGSGGYSSLHPIKSGINTLAGGNVTLMAGDDIISIPTSGNEPAGASGTYGAGNVTLMAGNVVEGNFQVADGVGTIQAGVTVQNGVVTQILNPNASVGSMAANGTLTPLNLNLISGSWNVWAAKDAFIGEVRNPNGTFAGPTYDYNYAPNAAFNLWAGNAITLDGSNLGPARNALAPVYPPDVSLNAGAGGITLNHSIILFPSSEGALQITTRDGGDLTGTGTATELTGITMSDGNPADYTTFSLGHSDPPLYANNPNPVVLNISGDINTFGLTVPTFAEITVGGGTYNFGFLGQNPSPAQTTSITVAGGISYRGDLSSVSLAEASALPAELFNSLISGLPEAVAKLSYNAATGTLTFAGAMTQTELAFLLNPTVQEFDAYGQPVLDANNNPVYIPVTLTSAQTAAINQLYAASQSATLNDQGLGISGPGHFKVTADSIDLGISGGIFAAAPTAAWAGLSPYGADITVTTTGDLSLTSSQIANVGLLGDINLNVGGTLNVGDNDTALGDPTVPRGIFTESGGNISIHTQGDVNLDSSRIAAYNGGNVTVESRDGNINAGNGGVGYVNVDAVQLDPQTGALVTVPTVGIPGSGILATTLPNTDARLGNILVETPRGNITASQGGVLQISFNGTPDASAIAVLLAGYELQDAHGNPVLAAEANNPAAATALVSANRDIDAGGSGIIAQNILARATGEVQGLFVGFHSVNLVGNQIGPGVAYGPTVNITDAGGGNNPTGPAIQSISDNPVGVNGIATAAVAPPTASVAKEVATVAEDATTVTAQANDLNLNKKPGGAIALRKVSRVTVLLPGAN